MAKKTEHFRHHNQPVVPQHTVKTFRANNELHIVSASRTSSNNFIAAIKNFDRPMQRVTQKKKEETIEKTLPV